MKELVLIMKALISPKPPICPRAPNSSEESLFGPHALGGGRAALLRFRRLGDLRAAEGDGLWDAPARLRV